MRGRIVLAAVAAGAFVAAGTTVNTAQSADQYGDATPLAALGPDGQTWMGMGGGSANDQLLQPQVLAFAKNNSNQIESLAKGARIGTERAAREAEARRPLYAIPTVGTLTSLYQMRWGTMHWGIDIGIGHQRVLHHVTQLVDELRVLGPGAWDRLTRVQVVPANRGLAGLRHGQPPIGRVRY